MTFGFYRLEKFAATSYIMIDNIEIFRVEDVRLTTTLSNSIEMLTPTTSSVSSFEVLNKIYDCTFDQSSPINCGAKATAVGTFNYFNTNQVLVTGYKITDVSSISKKRILVQLFID
jgi:hypothetical protein